MMGGYGVRKVAKWQRQKPIALVNLLSEYTVMVPWFT